MDIKIGGGEEGLKLIMSTNTRISSINGENGFDPLDSEQDSYVNIADHNYPKAERVNMSQNSQWAITDLEHQ